MYLIPMQDGSVGALIAPDVALVPNGRGGQDVVLFNGAGLCRTISVMEPVLKGNRAARRSQRALLRRKP